MKTQEIRAKTAAELQEELHALHKEQFNLRMQLGMKEAPRSHHVREVRRKIARIKTILNEKKAHHE
jgi:large subunit ribosomal protein L29